MREAVELDTVLVAGERRSIAILNARRMDQRIPLHCDLSKVTRKTAHAAETAAKELSAAGAMV